MNRLILVIGFLILSLSVVSQKQDYAEIIFIGSGKGKMIFLNEKPIRSLGSNEIIRYKIYSKGTINVSTQINYQGYPGTVNVEENKTYYYVSGKREIIKKAFINGKYISIEEAEKLRDSKGDKIWYQVDKV